MAKKEEEEKEISEDMSGLNLLKQPRPLFPPQTNTPGILTATVDQNNWITARRLL